MGMRGGGAGGGFSGKIDFPNYMRNFHGDYLIDNAAVLIPILLAGASPYNSAFAYDPDTDVDTSQERMDAYTEAVDALVPSDDIQGFLTDASDIVDTELLPDSYITDQATAFEVTNKPAYLRAVQNTSAGMQDVNSVHNSAFIIGLAIMESEFQNSIDSFTANLKMQRDQLRTNAVISVTGLMAAAYQLRLNTLNQAAGMQLENARFVVAAKQNQYDKDIELDVRDLLWDFDVLDRGGMVLGAINGAPAAPNPPGPIQQMGSMGLSTMSSLIPLLTML